MSTAASVAPKARRMLRLGSVSYLNAKPLIYGLEVAQDLELALDVPSRLLDGLRQKRFDVALLPVIDYQRLPGLRLVPGGCIGCDGPTLTVRIFSRVPIQQIATLACDADSHTSVALARVVLGEYYGIRPQFTETRMGVRGGPGSEVRPAPTPVQHEAMLLIGDKVVCEEQAGYDQQLDLGAAWKQMTGLPFVFAAWMARDGVDLGDLPARLDRALRTGMGRIEQIIERFAIPRGWPPELARRYMTEYLRYNISYEPSSPQLQAIRRFHELARQYGILRGELRDLQVAPYSPAK